MADFQATVRGIPELRAELMAIPAKLRKRALRNALAAGARLVQATARLRAPVLKLSTYSGASAFRRGVRKPGTLRKAISVRTSKISSRAGNVGVFVNVRPAKGAKSGAKSPDDPYYWRWVNFGRKAATRAVKLKGFSRRSGTKRRAQTGAYAGARFLEAGATRLGAALQAFIAKIGPAIAKLNQPRAPAP